MPLDQLGKPRIAHCNRFAPAPTVYLHAMGIQEPRTTEDNFAAIAAEAFWIIVFLDSANDIRHMLRDAAEIYRGMTCGKPNSSPRRISEATLALSIRVLLGTQP